MSTTIVVPAVILPTSFPLIGSVFLESAVVPGRFASVAGAALGTRFTLTPANVSALAAAGGIATDAAAACDALFVRPIPGYSNSTIITFEWSSPNVPNCDEAAAALARVTAAAVASGPATARLSFALSGATHMLLVAPRGGPPLPSSLSATLGGAPCAVNWVAADGSSASLTTPAIVALCASLGVAASASECGIAQLMLSSASWADATLPTIVAFASASATSSASLPLALPAAFPPALPGFDWDAARLQLEVAALSDTSSMSLAVLTTLATPFGELASLAGGGASALILAASRAPLGTGIRAIHACSDVSFAPLDVCAAAAFSSTVQLPPGTVCAHGAGDSCRVCPTGAVCPGGDVLYTLPGYWVPFPSSDISEIRACSPPPARCPGTAKDGAPCGAAFRGFACSACAPSFYPSAGDCLSCPVIGVNVFLASLRPIAAFVFGLLACAAVLVAGARATLDCTWVEAGTAVSDLAIWFWSAAQASASSFRVTQGLAPAFLTSLYSIFTSLQFRGVTLPKACYDSLPEQDAWAAIGAALGIVFACASTLACVLRKRDAPPVKTAPSAEGPTTELPAPSSFVAGALAQLSHFADARFILRVLAILLAATFPAILGAFTDTLVCTQPAPLPVRTYLEYSNDGTSIATALADPASALVRSLRAGAPKPTVADIIRATTDPLFALNAGLTAATTAPIPVSLVVQDPFKVCVEGAHRSAWYATAGVGAFFVTLVPLVGFWISGTLDKLLDRACRCRCAQMPRETTTQVRAELTAALAVADVRASASSFTPYMQILVGLLSAIASLSARESDGDAFSSLMGFGVALPILSACAILYVQPFEKGSAWKSPATAALLVLSAVSSIASFALFYAKRGGDVGSLGAAYAPLAVAAPLPPIILFFWWRSTSAVLRKEKIAALAREAAALARVEAPVEVVNPLHGGWQRFEDEDGDVWFVHRETGESVWTIPSDEPGDVGDDCANMREYLDTHAGVLEIARMAESATQKEYEDCLRVLKEADENVEQLLERNRSQPPKVLDPEKFVRAIEDVAATDVALDDYDYLRELREAERELELARARLRGTLEDILKRKNKRSGR